MDKPSSDVKDVAYKGTKLGLAATAAAAAAMLTGPAAPLAAA